MKRKILYSKAVTVLLRCFFGLFYEKKYLKGYWFEEKRIGWYWAYKGLRGRVFGENRHIPWPVHPTTIVSNAKNIVFGVDDLIFFQKPGCYIQNIGAKIYVGKHTGIAQHVGVITTNHDVYDLKKWSHVPGEDIVLGDYVWVGMNSVILPGVELGSHTVVGAGSVVTHSFPEGYCVIGGNPAKLIKTLEKSRFQEQ